MEKLRTYIDRYWLLVLAPALTAFFYVYDPVQQSRLFMPCIFHKATGLHCPGCGGQRAVHQLLHGNVSQAADYNLLLVLALPVLAANTVVWMLNRTGHRNLRMRWLYHPRTTRILLWVVLLFWVVRNIPVHPFTLLAP
ncbi:MAG: DUF2752 domain-containing protein [Cytophagales bacterium]|nr:DUF2752 domain-containing protein [Cytophagales bacterium]